MVLDIGFVACLHSITGLLWHIHVSVSSASACSGQH